MSPQHVVAVWEWCGDTWWSLGAPVSRQLERARAKGLTRVLLADADPNRQGEHVDLRHLLLSQGEPEQQWAVRRSVFSVNSAPARGVCWGWTRSDKYDDDPLPMEIQCLLEESLVSGTEVSWRGWRLSAGRGVSRGPGGTRLLRRTVGLPYPLARAAPAPPPRPGRTDRQVAQVVPTVSGTQSSPRDKRQGLARQILQNLNIFSTGHKCPSPIPAEVVSESDRDSRRHSVDTVSTYLSHESKDTQPALGDLLNCSVGSDEVFEVADTPEENHNGIVGTDPMSLALSRSVRVVEVVQWGALCPACVLPLSPAPCPTVALSCHHMLHLSCLNSQLSCLQQRQEPLYIECGVCGQVYGAQNPQSPPEPGSQPPGSMAWCLEDKPLPTFSRDTKTIRITYNFQSGIQSERDPEPGARYFAVGFPRHTLLPDTPLGRQILSQLLLAWQRCLLFRLARSQTTGRELVVSWCAPLAGSPPPTQYPAPLARTAHTLRLLLSSHEGTNC